jgi:hypothetical protein
MADPGEKAWAVHEAFRHAGTSGLRASPTRSPGHGTVSAVGPTRHGQIPVSVTGTGSDELSAVGDLDERLRGRENAWGRLEALRARLRLAYV